MQGLFMMIALLSGMKAMKERGLKKQSLRRSFHPSPGIPIVWKISACQKTRIGVGSNR